MEVLNEIKSAIEALDLKSQVAFFEADPKEKVIIEIKDIFVFENPRVWWLSLKYKPQSLKFDDYQYQYKNIINFFDENEIVWFIVEDDELILLKLKAKDIIKIISECSYFEYYIISLDKTRFLCENDHNEFLYIDLNHITNTHQTH
jgi:hypothetical protein